MNVSASTLHATLDGWATAQASSKLNPRPKSEAASDGRVWRRFGEACPAPRSGPLCHVLRYLAADGLGSPPLAEAAKARPEGRRLTLRVRCKREGQAALQLRVSGPPLEEESEALAPAQRPRTAKAGIRCGRRQSPRGNYQRSASHRWARSALAGPIRRVPPVSCGNAPLTWRLSSARNGGTTLPCSSPPQALYPNLEQGARTAD